MKKLVESLAVAEPNPTRYAELMSIYVAECLAAEGQPPVACLGLLVEEWGVELTVTEWKLQWEEAAAAGKKPAVRKKPAGKRGKADFCQGFAGDLCRFSAKEAGQPSRTTGGRNCLLCSEALLCQSQADPGRRGVLARILKALRAQEESPDIFEAACARLDLWLKAEEAAELRATAATAKRARPKQTRAAAQEERLRAGQEEIAAGAEVDNSPDLPAASYSHESVALQKWCLRGAWGMRPNCNILQTRPLTAACLGEKEHAATIQPSACKTCKRGSRKHYVPQFNDIPQPLRGLSKNAAAALRLLDFDLGPESRADNGYRKHVRMIRFSWATKTAKQKIAELPERCERRRAKAALRHLLSDDASACRKFHADRQEFLNLHDGEVLETAAKRSLHFIEELGLGLCVRRMSATPTRGALSGRRTWKRVRMASATA